MGVTGHSEQVLCDRGGQQAIYSPTNARAAGRAGGHFGGVWVDGFGQGPQPLWDYTGVLSKVGFGDVLKFVVFRKERGTNILVALVDIHFDPNHDYCSVIKVKINQIQSMLLYTEQAHRSSDASGAGGRSGPFSCAVFCGAHHCTVPTGKTREGQLPMSFNS